MPSWRSASAGLWLALLAACATAPAPLPSGVSFELTGRVAVRSDREAASGRLFWRHGPAFDDLIISTPLGQGIAEITRHAERYTLTTADSRRISATDPEALTEQALGWRLPLAGLPDWVRGEAYPRAASEVRYGQDARVQVIRQLGWMIEYLAYDERVGLPSRLRLTRDGLDIRLTIDSWATAPR
jgi:outer membrane lipoprotein LolB